MHCRMKVRGTNPKAPITFTLWLQSELSTINSHKNVYTPPQKKNSQNHTFKINAEFRKSSSTFNLKPPGGPTALQLQVPPPPWADPNSYIMPSPRRPSAASVPAVRRIGRHWSRRPRRLPGWLIHRQPTGHPRSFLGNCLCCCFFFGGGGRGRDLRIFREWNHLVFARRVKKPLITNTIISKHRSKSKPQHATSKTSWQ